MRFTKHFFSTAPPPVARNRGLLSIVAVLSLTISLGVVDLFSTPQQASVLAATTFTVTTTADSGSGSLRQAIVDANANPGQDTIAFNIAAAGVQTIAVTSALPIITDPVVIDGYTQPGAKPNSQVNGDDAVLLIELRGNPQVFGIGLQIQAGNSTVRGLVINRFGDTGIRLSSNGGNLIAGNFIGTNAAGDAAFGNSDGINISFCTNNTIGGTTPAARNVISGNAATGIFIGTQASGNVIQGNFIGTNAAGTAAVANNFGGIFSGGLGNDMIGGTADGARNLISGNLNNAGVTIQSASDTVQGNLIGTDVTGTYSISNFFGLWVNFRSNAIIGGQAPTARNVISGNRSHGILITDSLARNNQIQGNFIGTDATGTVPLGNAGDGIQVSSAINNSIGNTGPGMGNTIAFNSGNGISILALGTGDSIRGNAIFSNGGLGIDLNGEGVTPNDPGDADGGSNNGQNFPLITSVTNDASQTTITGTLDSTPNTTFSVNLYSNSACDPSGNGEGAVSLVPFSIPVTTDANGNASFGTAISGSLPPGHVITATATAPGGHTSEFSPCDSSKATGSVQFETKSLKVIEDVGFVTINVLRKGGSTGVLSVDYSTADITTTAGSDYTPASGTLTFNDGETNKSFDIPIVDDAITEPDESFVVRLRNGPDIDSLGSPNEEIITLQDHNTPPVLSMNSVSVNEGDTGTTDAIFTVTLSPLTGRTVSVNYQTVGGSATSGVDFQPTSGSLTFGPRQTTKTIVVPIIGDTIDEFNETFNVQLINPVGATVGNSGTGTIIDNDPPPIVSISDTVLVEGNSGTTFAKFNLGLSQPSGKFICVLASTADGTATAASGDYVQIGGSIFNPPANLGFNPGVTSAIFTVQVRGDPQYEANETFFAALAGCNGAVTIGRGQAVGTIINDDPQVPPSISISDVAVSDGNGPTNALFDVSLSATSSQTVTVQYATAAGTATTGGDFQPVSGTLTFDPGVTHQPVTVPIVPDSSTEGNETFTVNLSNASGGTLADSQGLCIISDGPPSQLPFLTINDITVVEGASGTTNVDFTVTLSQVSSQQVSFQYTTAPGTATENVDYMKVFGAALMVPGVTRLNISVPIVGDQVNETDETFFVNLSNPSGATIADDQGVGTIVNYVIPSIQFSGGTFVTEDVGSVTVIITRTGNALTTSVIDVATADGSASQRTDYTISAATLTFLPGETSQIFDVPIVNDLYVEGNETFNLILSNPKGAVLGAPSSAVITVLDDDSSPPSSNPLDNADARFFVRQHYYDFLNRLPDQSGFDFWSAQITQCGSDLACIRSKRIDVSNAFFYELEYQQTGAYVYRLYHAAFGNNQPFPNPFPDPNHPNEEKKVVAYQVFAPDRARVVGGSSLAQSQLDLANAFVQRSEFLTKYPPALDGPGFVDAILATIKNDIGPDLTAQRQALIDLFSQAGGGNAGRGAVLYRLADDNTQTNPINNRAFIDAEYNRAFVATQYFGYLRRDADMAGFLFWLGQVSSAPLRDVPKQHAMVCSFITSAEYQLRFSSVVTHTNAECPR